MSRVVAIGLDAFSPILLERWVEAGHLPTMRRLFEQGTYARQRNFAFYRTENSWLTLLHGCSPDASGEWGHQDYIAGEYRVDERGTYNFHKFAPFYALCDAKVTIFDLPLVGVVPGVNGLQVFGWGTEANQIQSTSSPEGAMAEIVRRHGRHPLYDTIFEDDDGQERLSYRIPSIYDIRVLRATRDKLIAALRQRTAIIEELIAADDWDLLMCCYGEIHTAGHLFWHASQVHTLQEPMREGFDEDLFLQTAQELDRALGRLIDLLPADTELLVFSPHGMRANSLDLNSMLFLPELLYRWSTGRAAFQGFGAPGDLPPPPRLDYRRHWRQEVWDLRSAHGDTVLESPAEQEKRGDPLDWDPGNWFRPLWPGLRAFALPGYSEGLIRINVAGRDGAQGIAPDDYAPTCAELTELLAELVDARSGERLVEEVVRVRTHPDSDPGKSPADLIVRWRDDLCGDLVDHPALGRIGPVPYFRTGGHAIKGFMLGLGKSFAAGQRLADVRTEDVTATILDRLGKPLPSHVDGTPIAKAATADTQPA